MARLKNGFTTGTAATAAAMAALLCLRDHSCPDMIETPLPPFTNGRTLPVPVFRTATGGIDGALAHAEVRKDGGDDPDVTHGMIIRADIYLSATRGISIEGGQGIGRATLPGLPIAAGQAAINPVPLAQITTGLQNLAAPALRVVISAPEGEARARGTMNSRLGILGGISILGTQGIVKPYSNAAYRASIASAMNIARATSCHTVCLGTGRRSIGLLQKLFPLLPPQAFIIAGDFVQDSLRLAHPFQNIHWGCFFGKLVKLAQGFSNTHAHVAELDMDFVARSTHLPQLRACITAQAALEQILMLPDLAPLKNLMNIARKQAIKFLGKQITIHLFHTDGRELARA